MAREEQIREEAERGRRRVCRRRRGKVPTRFPGGGNSAGRRGIYDGRSEGRNTRVDTWKSVAQEREELEWEEQVHLHVPRH